MWHFDPQQDKSKIHDGVATTVFTMCLVVHSYRVCLCLFSSYTVIRLLNVLNNSSPENNTIPQECSQSCHCKTILIFIIEGMYGF